MPDFDVKEKRFEQDIEEYLLTYGGYEKGDPASFNREKALDINTFQHNIDAIFILHRVMELSGTMQNISGILCLTGFVDGGFRFPKYCTEFDTTVSKSLTQHFQ